MKVTATPDSDYEFLHIDIGDVSLVDLYRDWNGGGDKYGFTHIVEEDDEKGCEKNE